MKLICIASLVIAIMTFVACESQSDSIKRLIPQLADTDPAVQSQAYKQLVAMGDPAVDPLIGSLSNSNVQVRRGAVWILGQSEDARAIAPLIGALADRDEGVRQYAAGALLNMGAPAVNPLISALKSNDIQVRCASARVLGQIMDIRSVGPLIDALQDSTGQLRQTAAVALGNIRDPRAVGPLIIAFRDNVEGVRLASVVALINIGPPAVDPLIAVLDDDAAYVITENEIKLEIRQEAAWALGKIGDTRAIQPLINAFTDSYWPFREYASLALVNIGTPAVGPLISLLSSNNSQLVREAARALGQIKDPRSVEPLITVIQNNDPPVSNAAFEALVSMGDVAHARLQAFLSGALRAPDLKTIAACYDYYIAGGDASAEPALVAALNLYADAYGNFDENGNVAIAERFLNCGNDNLHAAAVGWGAGHAFQLIVTPCRDAAGMWGPGVYDSYCGRNMRTWGNKPLSPTAVYVLWRGTNY